MHMFCHVEDCTVERGSARAELLTSAPDTWADAQIKTCLDL